MKPRFWKYTLIVAIIHFLVLAGLFGFSILPNPLEVPEENIMAVSVTVEQAPAEPESVPVEEPTPPEPDVPDPEPRRKIERSTTRVRREVPNQRPQMTPEEIRKRLSTDTQQQRTTTKPADPDSRFMSLIYGALYSAWQQPSAEAVGDATATARIRLGAGGTVISRQITRSSGITEMDGSIMSALNAVKKVNGLSQSFLSRHEEVTILFKVEG